MKFAGTPVNIDIAYGDLAVVLAWCQRYCQGQWHLDCEDIAGASPGNYTFYFEDTRDVVNFKLWQL